MSRNAHLPDDIQALKSMIIAQRAVIMERDLLIDKLRVQLLRLKRMQFGKSSEQLDAQIAQLELTLEELEVSDTQIATEVTLPDAARPERARPARRALPPHLPRETVTHDAACACPDCGGSLRYVGEDVAEVLERVPARFKVVRHVRPKFSCTGCQSIVQADAPGRPIARGVAGPALLAHVLVSKYTDHLPLYRQSEIYARDGVDLERSTLADWVGQCSALLAPLVDAVKGHVLAGTKVHGDDTPVPVLCPGRGTTRQGRLWTYVRDDRPAASAIAPAVWFVYSPDRKGKHPQEHLARFCGTLQADGYAGFNGLYERAANPLIEAACWAHARRKYYDVHQATQSPLALEAMQRIGVLYDIEEQVRGQLPDLRKQVRQSHAGPKLDALQVWLHDTLAKVSKKSELSSAIRYTLSRWTALTRYRDDGNLEIDNNAAERSLRAVALGRKNYLFAGSDAGGERAAAIYSLVGSAKLNGLDPEAYLRHVIERIADYPINAIADLLPWNVAATLAETEQKKAA